MKQTRKIDILGRIVIPSEMRELMSLCEGDSLTLTYEAGKIVLTPTVAKCCLCGSESEVEDIGLCKACISAVKGISVAK